MIYQTGRLGKTSIWNGLPTSGVEKCPLSSTCKACQILLTSYQCSFFYFRLPGWYVQRCMDLRSVCGWRNYLESFAQNPQYRITVTDPDDDDNLCTVIVLLMQKGRRAIGDEGMGCLTIGIAIIFQMAPNFFKAWWLKFKAKGFSICTDLTHLKLIFSTPYEYL